MDDLACECCLQAFSEAELVKVPGGEYGSQFWCARCFVSEARDWFDGKPELLREFIALLSKPRLQLVPIDA